MNHPTTDKEQSVEYELNTEQCVKVAQYMYREWEKAMQPPLLIYKSFPDWLELLSNTSNKEEVDT